MRALSILLLKLWGLMSLVGGAFAVANFGLQHRDASSGVG